MRNRKNNPTQSQALSTADKLKKIATAFQKQLSEVAALAKNKCKGKAQKYAAEIYKKDNGAMPLKHIIAATFALCEKALCDPRSNFYWRCSMSEHGDIKKVKDIMVGVDLNHNKAYGD